MLVAVELLPVQLPLANQYPPNENLPNKQLELLKGKYHDMKAGRNGAGFKDKEDLICISIRC